MLQSVRILVLWSVGIVELGGVEFEPFQDLVCRCKGVKLGGGRQRLIGRRRTAVVGN